MDKCKALKKIGCTWRYLYDFSQFKLIQSV